MPLFRLRRKYGAHPEIVKQTAEAGHEIGNHTYDHQNLATLSAQSMTEEVTKADTEIKKSLAKPHFCSSALWFCHECRSNDHPATDHRMVC